MVGGVDGTPNSNENSGNVPSGFQSTLPSPSTKVCALTRPSLIHWRSCSMTIGPYSFLSAPMILYIVCAACMLRGVERQGSQRCVSSYERGNCRTEPSAKPTTILVVECWCAANSSGPPVAFQPARLSKNSTVCGLISLSLIPPSFRL